ncbi:hypothetical protein HYY69_02680 [Candidatus Woesearchaeota archaeon]|nr:hypothetical protein [Candidatus Woesearchaeota archaeon]
MALYVPDRLVRPILDAGKKLVESSGCLIEDNWGFSMEWLLQNIVILDALFVIY